jgi:hypothetical protein
MPPLFLPVGYAPRAGAAPAFLPTAVACPTPKAAKMADHVAPPPAIACAAPAAATARAMI